VILCAFVVHDLLGHAIWALLCARVRLTAAEVVPVAPACPGGANAAGNDVVALIFLDFRCIVRVSGDRPKRNDSTRTASGVLMSFSGTH
jgi:hypothetical protein